MKVRSRFAQVVALICLAAILVAAVTISSSSGLFYWIEVPFFVFLAVLVPERFDVGTQQFVSLLSFSFPVLASRPPPAC